MNDKQIEIIIDGFVIVGTGIGNDDVSAEEILIKLSTLMNQNAVVS